jgi:hypothetical protein
MRVQLQILSRIAPSMRNCACIAILQHLKLVFPWTRAEPTTFTPFLTTVSNSQPEIFQKVNCVLDDCNACPQNNCLVVKCAFK